MKPFEFMYSSLWPVLPPLYSHINIMLSGLVQERAERTGRLPQVLDVGGRKSHYTIGLSAKVTISELPRISDTQKQLNLGVTDTIIRQTLRRRSNVEKIILDDMVHTQLERESYDIVVAIEVLEHVEADAQFLTNVFDLLRPGGSFFMTTPNGDYITKVKNPDHKRHYSWLQLSDLLLLCFSEAKVYYAIKGSRFRNWGLQSWSPRNPIATMKSMVGNYINRLESSPANLADQAHGTHHLIAIARKLAG